MITEEQLGKVCPSLKGGVQYWVEPLNEAMTIAEITTRPRISAFIAQCAHESCQFRIMEENLHYSSEQLMKTFKAFKDKPELASQYAYQPEKIGNFVYANREGNGNEESGDGYKFRGRGIFQITFRNNFRACSIAICKDENALLNNPEYLSDPDYACYAAAWYWVENDLNVWADKNDFDAISDIINLGRRSPATGDSNGFTDRLAFYKVGLLVF